jgi:hypothetical protein
VTIFKEMHETRVVNSGWDHRELLRMLSEAIARGYVEQMPVMKPHRYAPKRSWLSGEGNRSDIFSRPTGRASGVVGRS